MPPPVVLPSAEQLAVAALVDVDPSWGGNVSTELPPNPPTPWLLVPRGGGIPRPGPALWLDRPMIDVHVYHRTKPLAEETARLAHGYLRATVNRVILGVGVISSVEDVQGVVYVPDTDVGLPRYLFTVQMTTHPLP